MKIRIRRMPILIILLIGVISKGYSLNIEHEALKMRFEKRIVGYEINNAWEVIYNFGSNLEKTFLQLQFFSIEIIILALFQAYSIKQ